MPNNNWYFIFDSQDDELDDDDDEKSLLDPSLEDAVLKTPPESKPTQIDDVGGTASQKKVILKRKLIVSESENSVNGATPTVTTAQLSAASDTKAAEAGVTSPKVPKIPITAPQADDAVAPASAHKAITIDSTAAANGDPKNVVKVEAVAQLTHQERLDLRAKRFGGPKPAAQPTAVATKPATTPTKTAVSPLVDPEQLRKRAERFGLSTADETAKLAARAARFGLAEPKNAVTSTTKKTATPVAAGANAELVELMRKRAERFGGSVSKVMLEIESEDKRRQRLERFNADKAAAAAAVEKVDISTPAAAVGASAATAVADTAVSAPAVTNAE